MAWSTPMTATAGSFTAAQWNTYVRDNINETAPAKVTSTPTGAQWFVSSAANSLAIRNIKADYDSTEGHTNNTSFSTLDVGGAGPAVTITTGTKVIVQISARIGNSIDNGASQMTYNISGATSNTGDETVGVTSDGLENSSVGGSDNTRTVSAASFRSVTAGSNTFTMKYKCSSGIGYFMARRIVVWSF